MELSEKERLLVFGCFVACLRDKLYIHVSNSSRTWTLQPQGAAA